MKTKILTLSLLALILTLATGCYVYDPYAYGPRRVYVDDDDRDYAYIAPAPPPIAIYPSFGFYGGYYHGGHYGGHYGGHGYRGYHGHHRH